MNYAAAASKNGNTGPAIKIQHPAPSTSAPKVSQNTFRPTDPKVTRPKRAPSPSHIPKTSSKDSHGEQAEEVVYVLTLLTDQAHHTRMTEMRTKYFPPRLNKLDAHLTLFHALPASRLESSILPTLAKTAADTAPFEVHATRPFRLKKGIAIAVPKTRGGAEAQEVHRRLQEVWAREGWLSDQDAQQGMQSHYTLMNKEDSEEVVAEAFEEVRGSWKADVGVAEGLGLWRYDRGWWRWERKFSFGDKA